MSTLEETIKPILAPLILGEAAVLTGEAQRNLACWIVMKCMVCEYDNRDVVVSTQDDRSYLMEHLEPPTGWRVFIAEQYGIKWRTGWIQCAACLGTAPKGQRVTAPDANFAKNTQSFTFGFGKLLIHATYTRRIGIRLEPAITFPVVWKQIWPASPGFLWPAGAIISDEGATMIAFALDRFIRSFARL